jgi:uncharacterized protein
MIYTEPMSTLEGHCPPAIIDSHAHIYSRSVISNVLTLDGLATALGLDVSSVGGRMDKDALKREAGSAGVRACLLLPTAPADGVRKVNELYLKTVEGEESLFTAGTLHPAAPGMDEEIERLSGCGVRAIKLCSFSQGFNLEAEDTLRLFDRIRAHNIAGKPRLFVVLDTFYKADFYFRIPQKHVTTPKRLGRLVASFPEIDFVGAHMGGLTAPFAEINKHLAPRNNLYLDTSNAAALLPRKEFLNLLRTHGPERILFGTDWPWFGHREEVPCIQDLLQEAGFSPEGQAKVFRDNISRLLNI